MIEQFTSSVAVNNSQEPWLVGEGVVVSGSVAIPSLDFDFITGGLPGTVTFTRASTATYFDSAGVLQSAAIDAPRFDYNPITLAAQGLLIEEQRTNSIRNNTMQGAVAGTPGTAPTNWVLSGLAGLAQTIVGIGTENGIAYIDVRIFGTTTSAMFYGIAAEGLTSVAAAPNSIWTNSWYVKLVGGSTTGLSAIKLVMTNFNASGVALNQFLVTTIVPTSAALNTQRFTQTSLSTTFSDATTAFVRPILQLEAPTATAIDITLRIGLPQLELGAFATSVIPTTTTALTRSADDARVNTLSPWYNQSAGTLFVERIQQPIDTATARRYINICDGTTANSIQKYQSTSGISAAVTSVGGVASFAPSPTGIPAQGSVVKTALSFDGISKSMCRDAGTVFTDAIASPTSGMTTMFIGSQLGTAGPAVQFSCTWIRRITYYPRKLSSAELQAITA